jgi:hypothetical protein
VVTRPDAQYFNVVLTRRQTQSGEATRVQFEWATMVDGRFKGDVMASVGDKPPLTP